MRPWAHRLIVGLVYIVEARVEVTAPLRSGPLQWHLHWESILSLAETVLRERKEAELVSQFAQLRQQIFQWSPQVWASTSRSELLFEMNAAWPKGRELIQMATAQDLKSLGFVILSMRNHLTRLEQDWEDMQKAVSEWNSEAKRSTSHLPVNFEILLKQASVLQGLLAAAPGFHQCLEQSLERARTERPKDDLYRSAMMFIQTAQLEGDLKSRVSTFGRELPNDLGLDQILHATRSSLEDLQGLGEKETNRGLDWCSGVRELWIAQNDPCAELAKDLARLRAEVIAWEEPQKFLRTYSRFQFSVTPNITRIELLTDILAWTQDCTVGTSSFSGNFSSELQRVAADDRASLEEEYHILHRAARILQPARDGDVLGLLGLIRGLLEAQHTIHLIFDEASTWAFRIRSRGNGLQLRLQEVMMRLNSLHDDLKSLPNYRSLAFKEIHTAGHWGKLSSGSGSSQQATSSIGVTVLHFLRTHSARSMLDVGCGFGEWLPTILLQAVKEGSLPKDFRYFGVDIAEKPIDSLRARFGHAFQFAVADACRDPLPTDFSVALVRHVFQHLTLADAFSLLRNVQTTAPQLLVVSSWPEATNQDLETGSSAFGALAPSHESFKGYDLRKPPFNFPEPLQVWKEAAGEELLLYPITVFEAMPWSK